MEAAGAILAALGLGGSVLAWLVRIEHRLTRLETTIVERLPQRGQA